MMAVQSNYMLVFRILHITAGVLWVGSAFFFTFFLEPALASLGPAAGPLMDELVNKRKVPIIITALAGTTVLGGFFLFWRDVQVAGSLSDFLGTGFGKSLTFGAVCALIAFFAGLFGIKPRVEKMEALGAEIAAAGGPPSEAQGAQMHKIQEEMRMIGRVDLVLLVVAVVAMATAQVW